MKARMGLYKAGTTYGGSNPPEDKGRPYILICVICDICVTTK
jgi:hypothetical protein